MKWKWVIRKEGERLWTIWRAFGGMHQEDDRNWNYMAQRTTWIGALTYVLNREGM